jgi:hypothetical protein
MANTKRIWVAVTVCLAAVTVNPAARTKHAEVTIVLHVEDFASLLSSTRVRAEQEVTEVFMQGGVHVRWVDGRRPAKPLDEQPHVSVQILNGRMGQQKRATDGIAADVLGLSARELCRVWIFYDRVEALTNPRPGGDRGEILGRVIAHEIGHLLLPAPSDSQTGIMRGGFDLYAPIRPLFTANEAAAIRSTLAEHGYCERLLMRKSR